nr:unnamed protein product [Callosobruchus analis]
MANRRRGSFCLPKEFQTEEKLSTKKEMAQRKRLPPCPPVPNRNRKSTGNGASKYDKPRALSFYSSASLSPLYDSSLSSTYFEQMFTKHHLIGEGSFGKVYQVKSKSDNEVYAVKRLKSMISWKDKYAEVKNNEKVGVHPNCVRFYMAWEEGFDVYMLLEFCDMSLSDFSNQNSDIPEDLLMNVLYDICMALDYLHKNSLLHLDVKPGNIMMKKGHYKLGDFGILVDLKLAPTICKSTLSDGDSKYLALEVLEGVYKPSCDIFGLGISLLELASDLELPSNGPLWQQLRHEVLPQAFYDRVSLGFKVIIERMLKPQHDQRPSAEKILKFSTMRTIEKRDRKSPRIDYAAEYANDVEQMDLSMEDLPVIINNNNIFVTPPCSHEQSNSNDNDMEHQTVDHTMHSIGRKNLFNASPKNENHRVTLNEINDMLQASLNSHNDSLPSIQKNQTGSSSHLAVHLSDSDVMMDVEESLCTGSSTSLELICDDIITSTPLLNIRKLPPKTRLSFD